MRFFLRTFFLPLIFAASLIAPAHAQSLKLTSMYGVSLGMNLDEAVSRLEDAGFVVDPQGKDGFPYAEMRSEHYEGSPAFQRFAHATFEAERTGMRLIAVRALEAAEDDWQITLIERFQDFRNAELQPQFADLFQQSAQRIGADVPTCMSPDDSHPGALFVYSDDALVPASDDDASCELAQKAGGGIGSYDTLVMLAGRTNVDDRDRLTEFTISLRDGPRARILGEIHAGTYGKTAPTIGDF